MNFKDFKKLVCDTRTTRRFKKDITIENIELEEVLDAARVVSSAKNMQPLKYITVTDKDLVKKLAQTCQWAAHLKEWNQKEEEQPSAFIIVLNDTKIDGFAMLDCGIALNNIMLGLKIKGYSSCPLASIDKQLCKELFSLDEKIEPMLGIAIGVEDETIKVVDVKLDTNYYRDEIDIHCVPKRDLNDVLIGKF
ncbi:nitroreductase family protein [Halarcobacter sp.]|uniref:nitroreductase family protein n=1 Tax=Halarcobacter sp. TaxID=2321133 RepID=UPI0029F56401|nr:nitroreductase family protein [Halarcobacter sp.]